ncbi:MAG TPA: hypothetical protein VIS52_06120 [Motiliproteus sp.]
MAMLCRGAWAVQLAQHASAPLVDPFSIAAQHGHHHAPQLNHLHPNSSGLSDEDHPLVHSALALDLYGVLPLPVLPGHRYEYSMHASDSFNPPPAFASGLYRPPRPVAA